MSSYPNGVRGKYDAAGKLMGLIKDDQGLEIFPLVEGGGSSGSGYWSAANWTQTLALIAVDLALPTPTLNTGYKVMLMNDLESRGVECRWTGTRPKWPRGYALDRSSMTTGLSANALEQMVKSPARIPSTFLQAGDLVRVYITAEKSAAAGETMTVRLKQGPLGTVADTAVLATLAFSASAQVSTSFLLRVKNNLQLEHVTTTQVDAYGTATTPFEQSTSSTIPALPTAITVSDLNAESFLSLTVQMSVGTQTPTIVNYLVELL